MAMTVRAVLALVLVLLANAAAAADDRTAGVAGTVSALNIDSATAVSFSGSFEYRFTRVVGLEIDATLAPRLKSPYPGYTILSGSSSVLADARLTGSLGALGVTIFPGPTFTNPGGRAVIFSNNVRIVIPTTAARVEPYFVAGGGIASVRHTADLVYTPIFLSPASPIGVVAPTIRPVTQRAESSSLNLALTLGGGVSLRTVSQLWIEADLRLVRLLGDTDTNVGRFGVGVRYRFK